MEGREKRLELLFYRSGRTQVPPRDLGSRPAREAVGDQIPRASFCQSGPTPLRRSS
jgi:hypothetical protein